MKTPENKGERLGDVLQQANLVSAYQIEEALKEQKHQPQHRIGEILSQRGWLKQETVDFFAEKWAELLEDKKQRKPIGEYLKEAALLDEQQIKAIVTEQERSRRWVRLGALAALKGWLKQTTVDFFLEKLYPEHAEDSPFVKVKKRN